MEERLEVLGYDPLAFLAEIMMDEKQPVSTHEGGGRFDAVHMAEAPRDRAHECRGFAAVVVILGALPDATAEAWEARNQAVLKGKPQ